MQKRGSWILAAALAGFCHAMMPVVAYADEDHRSEAGEHREDHDEARYLVDKGNIRPLPEVLRALHSQVEGEVIDVTLRLKDLRWIYLCKLVTPAGRRLVVPIDAASLVILEG